MTLQYNQKSISDTIDNAKKYFSIDGNGGDWQNMRPIIAKTKPSNLEDLEKIKGFAGQKIAKFGKDIIALMNSI